MDKIIKREIESAINKILYKKNIIEKQVYEEIATELDKLIFKENKKKTKNKGSEYSDYIRNETSLFTGKNNF